MAAMVFLLLYLLGMVSSSLLKHTDSESTGLMISSDSRYPISPQKSIVETRSKVLIEFQDKMKNNPNENMVDERISKLENEVGHLKTKRSEDEKVINQLMDRIERLEVSSNVTNECSNDKVGGRPKRPASLLPLELLLGKPKNSFDEEVQDKRFYGPPTSCDDLGKLGYTLNGYYLVKNSPQNKSWKIQVIYCQFKSPEKQVYQTFIGNVDIKTKNVHFYVQKNKDFNKKGILSFELERLNEGGAMNLTSGIFTAPVPGIYHFQFSGVSEWGNQRNFEFIFQLNGEKIAAAFTSTPNESHNSASLTASLRLKANDTVSLYNEVGGLHDNSYFHFTNFAGWLVEQDFIL